MLCRSKADPIQIDRLANRPTMKTASTSIDIVEGANNRINRIEMTEKELDATNKNATRELILGDSWFSSVDLVEHIAANYIGVVKTNHSRYPKDFIMNTMKPWPAGSHLVLRTVLNEGRRNERTIFALGYKYSKSKVLCFIFTEGAGHTECKDENSYEAKWKDEKLNQLTRKIRRPQVCHAYFTGSNIIDVLNQNRQYDLALEKHWVTQDGNFRIMTTLFGVTVVDAFKAYVWHCGQNHRHKKMPLLNFTDMMCKDMLENGYSSNIEYTSGTTYSISPPSCTQGGLLNGYGSIDVVENASATGGVGITTGDDGGSPPFVGNSQLSDLTMSPSQFGLVCPHILVKTKDMETYGYSGGRAVVAEGTNRKISERTMRRKCSICQKKTSFYCKTCKEKTGLKKWICPGTYTCFELHCAVVHNCDRFGNTVSA